MDASYPLLQYFLESNTEDIVLSQVLADVEDDINLTYAEEQIEDYIISQMASDIESSYLQEITVSQSMDFYD